MTEQDLTRAALVDILNTCWKALGYEGAEVERVRWIAQRQEAIQALRGVCADFGDNDWDENLSLADVIEKHLERHLYSNHTGCPIDPAGVKDEG